MKVLTARTARRRCAARLALVAFLALPLVRAGEARAQTFTRGFADDVWVYPANSKQTPQEWARNAYAAGARMAEVEVDWDSYEPQAPVNSGKAGNPRDPIYSNWSELDTIVRTLTAAKLQPMFMITDAPAWAQANHGRYKLTEGYEPDDKALMEFMHAIATRYDGHYRNPTAPHRTLPRVRYFQDWAEANLTIKLAPQWARVHGAWVNVGATIYRNLLNSFYAGVKAAAPSDVVIFSGLEAYGDPPGTKPPQGRVHPVTFLENVLCLSPGLLKVCNETTHFDVMAMDPYDVGPPTTHAVALSDASAPDMARIQGVLHAAVGAHTVFPDREKPIWVTEFSYDSNPPNPEGGLPLARQARWLEQSLYVFWKQGVSTVFWYLIRDNPGRDFAVNYYSGIYFYDGRRKPSYTAYRFPLVVAADGTKAQIWGIAPSAGNVVVQQRLDGSWRTIHVFRARAGAVFEALTTPPSAGNGDYRALEGANTSLVWSY